MAACALRNLVFALKEEEFPDVPDDPIDGVEEDADDGHSEEPNTATSMSLQQRIVESYFRERFDFF